MLLQPQNLTECSRTFKTSLRPNIAGFSQPAHHPASGREPGDGPDSSRSVPSSAQFVPTGPKPDQGSDFTSDRNTYESNPPTTSSRSISSNDREENSTPINTKSVEKKSIIFNYSSIELTEPMKRLLGRGLNFSVLPKKLDTTQVMVDFERFKISMLWSEFMYGREEQEDLQREPIFKRLKTNLPKNNSIPEDLKVFLHAVQS